MKTQINFFVNLVAFLVLLLGGNAAYANTAGYVQFVNGDVQLTTSAGQTHSVQKGEAVNEGDTMISAKAASAQIKMQDGGFVALRPDTQLKFDNFKFSGKEDGSEQSFFSLFKGGFRAVTGLIGRINKPNYRIITPTATIGIRGTDHETFVVVPGSELAAVAPSGAYNRVNIGETSMTTEKGTIFVLPNQMGFAGAADQMPKLQPINTNIFTGAAELMPQAKGDKKEGKEEGVRESAVVDNTAKEKVVVPALTTATPENMVTTSVIQLPITTTGGITLTGGGAPTVAPTINTLTEIFISYYDMPIGGSFGVSDNMHTNNYTALPSGYTQSGGNLVSVTGQFMQGNGGVSSETISGGMPSGPFTVNGITYGYYAGKNVAGTGTTATLTGTGFQGAFTYTLLGTYHWINVPDASPFYLSMMAFPVRATYTAIAGVATDQNNAFGAVNLATTSLTVDFVRQAVSLNLNATSGTYSWNATATDIQLNGSGGFNANSGSSSLHQNLTVTLANGTTPSAGFGDVSGNLGGLGLNGAGLAYTLVGYDPLTPFGHQHLNGSVVFSGVQQSATRPYTIGLVAVGMTPAGATDPSYSHWVNGGINDFSRVALNANGIPIGFDGDALVTVPANGACSPTPCPAYVTQTPASFSIPNAMVVEWGSDPLTGISWGRYAGGQIAVTDRIASTLLGNINLTVPGVSVHGIFSGQQSAPTVLPVSGNFVYTLAGNTSPTDNAGNAGTLTSATFTAHFTTQTVDAAVNLNIPATAQTWVASATGVPILQGTYFEARKEVGGATTPPLSVTMNGSPSNTTGQLTGGFTGTTGQGVGVAYSLNVNGNAGTTVSGVAAFHR